MDINDKKPILSDTEPVRSRYAVAALIIIAFTGGAIYTVKKNFYKAPEALSGKTAESIESHARSLNEKKFLTKKKTPLSEGRVTSKTTSSKPITAPPPLLPAAATVIESIGRPDVKIPAKNILPKTKKTRRKKVWKGAYSPFITQKFMVIRNKNDWKNIWTQINIGSAEKDILPEINFKKYILLALFLGQQNTGGHSIELVKLDHEKDMVIAYYRINKPDENSLLTQSLIQPYFIKRVKASKLPFTFIEKK